MANGEFRIAKSAARKLFRYSQFQIRSSKSPTRDPVRPSLALGARIRKRRVKVGWRGRAIRRTVIRQRAIVSFPSVATGADGAILVWVGVGG